MSIAKLCLLSSILFPLVSSNKRYIYVGPETKGDGGLRLGREEAEQYCQDNYNGHLATIESDDENTRVALLCKDFGQLNGGCLIGLNNAISTPSLWTNGKSLSYTNWDTSQNEPDKTGDQPYVIIRSANHQGSIAGVWVTTKPINFPFICEQDGQQYIHIPSIDRNYEIYGEQLLPGAGYSGTIQPILASNQALVSNNNQYVAAMQPEGNLVVYDLNQNGAAIWYTDTTTAPDNQFLVLQSTDGNLVVYNGANGVNGARWASHRGNYPGQLIMQGDGNLVVYDASGIARWDSMGHTRTQYLSISQRPYEIYGEQLGAGAHLKTGQALLSNNELFAAVLRNEGDLCIYKMVNGLINGNLIWNSGPGSWDQRDRFLILQDTDGHLVIYNGPSGGNSARWSNGATCQMTNGAVCADGWTLIMQDDGNLVVYDKNDNPIWHTSTHGSAISDVSNMDVINGNYSDGKSTQIGMNLLYILSVLIIINCICGVIYCFNQKKMNKERNYKVVSMV